MKRARLPPFVSLCSLLALAAWGPGCASKCGSACPATEVTVVATPGENLDWTVSVDGGVGTSWTGPACPSLPPSCRGDGLNPCQRFDIFPSGEGTCDLTITTTDRPPFVVHAVFGPPTTVGCCHGFTVVGPSLVTVPPFGSPPQDAGLEAPAASDDGGGDAASNAAAPDAAATS